MSLGDMRDCDRGKDATARSYLARLEIVVRAIRRDDVFERELDEFDEEPLANRPLVEVLSTAPVGPVLQLLVAEDDFEVTDAISIVEIVLCEDEGLSRSWPGRPAEVLTVTNLLS
jgi:hypothetical protein